MQKKKIICAIACFMCFIGLVTNTVFADGLNINNWKNVSSNQSADGAAVNLMSTGAGVIQIVGAGMALIMLTYVGIKYMMASAEDRAEFKKSMQLYIFGAILVFAGSTIVSLILNFTENNLKKR